MPKAILIAEKPSLMRDIRDAYRDLNIDIEIDFFALRGHIYGLKDPEEYKKEWGNPWKQSVLPMIPENFELKEIKGVKEVVRNIKEALKKNKYDFFINACDSAREGELIFYNLYDSLPKKYQYPVKRLWAHDTTKTTLKKALKSLIDGSKKELVNLQASAKLRARWDWILGINFTRLFTLVSGNLSIVGRVVTPTLKLVIDRDDEIENFKSKNSYEYQAKFKHKNVEFIGRLLKNQKVRLDSDKDFEKIKEKLFGVTNGVVKSIEKVKQKSYAPPIYNLSDLQRDASKVYKYSPKKTLDIAQSLYEKHKILSYPRTESRYIPTAIAEVIEDYLKEPLKVYDNYKNKINKEKIKNFKDNKRYVDNSKITDHHGLLPTLDFKVSKMANLNQAESNVFNLVLTRFISIFFNDYEEEKTTAIIGLKDEDFRVTGSTVVDLGFKVLWNKKPTDSELPILIKGEKPAFRGIKKEIFKSKPPLRYTKGTLLEAMENADKNADISDGDKVYLKSTGGLGTAATRADIIEKLFSNGYTIEKKDYIYPTEKGINLINLVKKYSFSSPILTAKWEKELKAVEDGEMDYKRSMEEFKKYMVEETKDIVEQTKERMSMQEGGKVGECPICGRDVVNTRFAFRCEDYKSENPEIPPCNFSVGKTICEAEISESDIKAMLSGEKSELKHMVFKSGNEGDVRLSINPDGTLNFEFKQEVVAKCPKCGSNIVQSKKFFLCEHYKDERMKEPCTFIVPKETITKKELLDMLDGKETKVKHLKNKAGKKYDAYFTIENGELKYNFE